jgi:hypothetical protein
MVKEGDRVMYLAAADVERTLDLLVEGLIAMDLEVIEPLAGLCRDWESRGLRLSVPAPLRARLSWKLLLLERLLRQTRVNLQVFGLEHARRSPEESYREVGGTERWRH